MVTINLKLPEELRDEFKVYCATQRTTMTQELVRCIRERLGIVAKSTPVARKPKPLPVLRSPIDNTIAPEPFDNSRLQKNYTARKAKGKK